MLNKINALFYFCLYKKLEYINGDKQILDSKLLSKIVGSNVNDYAISTDFSTIICWCTQKNKARILKMRKYLKATKDESLKQYAKRFIK